MVNIHEHIYAGHTPHVYGDYHMYMYERRILCAYTISGVWKMDRTRKFSSLFQCWWLGRATELCSRWKITHDKNSTQLRADFILIYMKTRTYLSGGNVKWFVVSVDLYVHQHAAARLLSCNGFWLLSLIRWFAVWGFFLIIIFFSIFRRIRTRKKRKIL